MMAAEEQETQSPFRQQALEYIATPKALDDLIQVVPPLAWVSALALWLILASIVVWVFCGSIVTHITGKGIVLTGTEAVVYVSALEAERLRTGMQVSISPSTRKQWEYNRIPGRIISVENLPATPDAMLATLKNPSLVSYFLRAGPVVTLRAQLSGLASGSLIDVRITTHKQTPLALMLSR
jgi:hypothetical protein